MALHARIAETLESEFAEISESQPELLARHCTEAGLIEKAVGLWGKAGQRSLERSALVEAIEQLTRALDQIASLPATPALRREQIKLQVALITPLIHVKGYAAPETKAAEERARLLIEQADALGETLEDPLLLFRSFTASGLQIIVAFNGDVMRELAADFLALAEKQSATLPLIVGHRPRGHFLDVLLGNCGRPNTLGSGNPVLRSYRTSPLATRFGQDPGGNLVATERCSVAAWLSRKLRLRTRTRRSGGARNPPSRYVDVRAWAYLTSFYLGAEITWQQIRS